METGAKHFREFARRNEPEWSLWGVEGKIDEVALALAEMNGGKVWSRDILDKPRARNGAEVTKITAIVSVKGSAWVIGFRTVGFFMMDQAERAEAEALGLSKKLRTRGMSYHREDISGSVVVTMFENGKKAGEREDGEWEDHEVDKAFAVMGIYVPACGMAPVNGKIELRVWKNSKEFVEGAYLVLGK